MGKRFGDSKVDVLFTPRPCLRGVRELEASRRFPRKRSRLPLSRSPVRESKERSPNAEGTHGQVNAP